MTETQVKILKQLKLLGLNYINGLFITLEVIVNVCNAYEK